MKRNVVFRKKASGILAAMLLLTGCSPKVETISEPAVSNSTNTEIQISSKTENTSITFGETSVTTEEILTKNTLPHTTGSATSKSISRSSTMSTTECSTKASQSTQTTSTTQPVSKNPMLEQARLAQQDMFRNFWVGSESDGHIVKEDQGYPIDEKRTQIMIWAHAMMVFGMETMAETTGDPTYTKRITAQWEFTKKNFTREQMTRPGVWPNIAADDAGWDAMAYMAFYRATGDVYALDVAGETIRNAYEYWMDGTPANGLWYRRQPERPNDDATFKSLYSVGLVIAALDYCHVRNDADLLEDTIALYEWMEQNLLRDGIKKYPTFTVDCSDYLYFTDFNVNRPGRDEYYGPDGGMRPTDIQEAGSVSFLGGNMAMGVIHARLYALTGKQSYKERALRTVRAITDGVYNDRGVFLNDRDAWSTATFMRQWVSEVLTLPGVTQRDKDLVYNSAKSIYSRARTAKGYYGGSWRGPATGDRSKWYRIGSVPEQIMTSANSTNVIFAAALLESLDRDKNT